MIGVLLLIMPAAVANMTPVIVARLPFLGMPLDGGLTLRGHRVFGDNKTVRGFVFGTLAAIGAAWLQHMNAEVLAPYALVDYAAMDPILFGFLAGFGALAGDAGKSFFKRQFDIPPGNPWPPFDQLDWIIGMFLFIAPLVIFPLSVYVSAALIGGLLHPLASILGHFMGLKKDAF